MSYANGTTHYNLPQTVGTDKRDWFDTNTAFQNVDADLYSAKTTADNNASDITALTTRVGTAEGDITSLTTRVGNAEGDISALQSSQTTLGNKVADVKADLSDAICAIKEADATADYAHGVGEYFWYNDTLYITTSAIAIGDTIVPNTNCNTVTITSELLSIIGDIPDVSGLQPKSDNNLATTDKTVVGAINEINSDLSAYTYDTSVDLSGYTSNDNQFTATADGYVRFQPGSEANSVATLVLNGQLMCDLHTDTANSAPTDALFIRKGMTVYFIQFTGTGKSARFFPLK